MRFLILISLLALVAVVAATKNKGELKPKALTAAGKAVPVNVTLSSSNSTTAKPDANGTTTGASTTEASGTETSATGESTTEASTTTVVAKA